MSKTLRILFLEDIPHDAEIAIATLKAAGYHCEWERIDTREDFLNRLSSSEYDLVLADYSLPSFDGITAVGLFLERGLDIPFILISGTLGEEAAVEVLKAGASDFVLKSRLFRLPDVVERALKERKERHQAEEAGRQIRLQAAALESAANAIVITDRRGFISFVNPAFTKLTGYSRDEVVQKHIRILKSGEHDGLFYKDLWGTILSGKVWHGEMINRRKDGSHYAEEQTITPVTNDAGEIINFIAVKQDVTERNASQAENDRLAAEVAAERGRLTKIVANVPGIVWEAWARPKSTLLRGDFVSSHVETMLGYSVEEWLAKPKFWLDIAHPDDRRRMAMQSKSILRGGANNPLEFRWIAKDGRTVWAEAHGAVIYDEDGSPIGMRGVTIDVTERKKAEVRFRRLVDSNAQGVFFWNAEGSIRGGNEAFLKITGYTQDDMDAGLINWVSMTPPEYNHLDRKALGEIAATGVCSTFEKEWIRKDGSRVPIMLGAAAIDDDLSDGVSFALDLTDRKQLENQLHQSQKMEAIGVLAGGIAHDFNNLLTAINGYSDLILNRMPADDPSRPNVQEVRKAGDRAANLTNQLLAFSRRQVTQPIVHNINTVISSIETMLQRIIRENIELRTVLDPALGNISADPGQIEQILMNLVVNAREAMPDGGELTIETQNVFLDGEYANQHIGIASGNFVKMAVTDTGEGIAEEIQPQIFEPFFTTKEVGKGTGLGLSIVYGLVKQSGGEIMVYSEIGRGTTFKVYLPVVDEKVREQRSIDEAATGITGTETILLVEDEDIVRELVRTILSENGYKILEASNGIEALAVCDSYRDQIHLLLTDFIMPKMNGMQLKDQIIKLLPDIKFLFMSGYTDDSIARSEGFNAETPFIEKPFTPDSLSKKVRDVLEFVDVKALL